MSKAEADSRGRVQDGRSHGGRPRWVKHSACVRLFLDAAADYGHDDDDDGDDREHATHHQSSTKDT